LPKKLQEDNDNELSQEIAEFFKRGELDKNDEKKVLKWAEYFKKKSEK
jgi:hypothetical protein